MKLQILGDGGHARELAWMVEKFVNEYLWGYYPIELLSKNDELNQDLETIAFGVADPSVIKVMDKINRKVGKPKLVANTVYIDKKSVSVDEGVQVFPGCIITVDISIGRGSIIGRGCQVGHDSVIGDYCVVNPGATLSGGVKLGEGCLIGSDATILQGVEVASGTRLGAGAVLTKSILEPNQVWVGVPAKPIGE